MARRVGSGESINICTDPWLPDCRDPYVHTVNTSLKGQMVACLMVTGHYEWDVELVKDLFEERDANQILSILL